MATSDDVHYLPPRHNSWTDQDNWQPAIIKNGGDKSWTLLSELCAEHSICFEAASVACKEDEELNAINLLDGDWLLQIKAFKEYFNIN